MEIVSLKLFCMKLYKKLPTLFYDALGIPVAWYSAYWLRLNAFHFESVYAFTAVKQVLVIQLACFYFFSVYRGLWCFTAMSDLVRMIKSVIVAVVCAAGIFYCTSLSHHIPRSIFPLYALVLLSYLSTARLVSKFMHDAQGIDSSKQQVPRVLIIGAGNAGEMLARDLKKTNAFFPVGFIDDNTRNDGKEIHGIAVLGNLSKLSDMIAKHHIDLLLIAIPDASSAYMRKIVHGCEISKIPFRTLPSLSGLAAGEVTVSALREVSIDDLLGRDAVSLDWDKITQSIQHKRVLVSGGGGSIGSELCRQIMALQPEELLVVDHSEFNLYQIDSELRALYPNAILKIALLSVTDKKGMAKCFASYQPHIVFHAAAYKHVPMLEEQVRVGILNNIIGTQVIAELSVQSQVEKFVLISTDKAVNPSNVMGATKRVAEIFCQNINEQVNVNTQFITVRFGNVLGSAGSVVPLFQKQIEKGGPVTVTHPDIERFFMTIPEASQLILQAMINGKGGEIFVLDMGEPIKIRYLAEQMIKLAGHGLDEKIQIEFTGLRPGEKLYEELFYSSEALVATTHEKVLKASFRSYHWPDLCEAIELMKTACYDGRDDELHILLKNLVPEFTSSHPLNIKQPKLNHSCAAPTVIE